MRFEFYGHLSESGHFDFIDKNQWQKFRRTQKPGNYLISLRREGRRRQLNQNNLYWLRNEVLCKQPEIDISKDGIHDYLMAEAGYGVKKEFRGRTIFDRESSTQLTVDEFSNLMSQQDVLAKFVNEGREPHLYMELPTT